MSSRVFLVRHGLTDWHRERRVLGQRDISLNVEGRAQARAVASMLAPFPIGEVLSSPLVRAVETAEVVATVFGLDIARDPRLSDFRVGRWEGLGYDEVAASPEYQSFFADPLSTQIPGGEDLRQIRDRACSALEQALRDAPTGESIAVVTHAGIVRVLLTHYLGSPLATYHRLRVAPGSVSVLSFDDDRKPPRVLAVNCVGPLKEVL